MPANTKAIFQEMFANFQDYYVLIGGTATSIVLDSQGFKSRATKDYDMVIIDELKGILWYLESLFRIGRISRKSEGWKSTAISIYNK